MPHIILSLPQCHSRGYTQDKFISMYHRLFSHGNAGWMGNPTQNLASSVAVHKLENLLAANMAHGKKLVALILFFLESRRDKGSPEPPEPAVREACGGALLAGAAGCSMQRSLHSTSHHSS